MGARPQNGRIHTNFALVQTTVCCHCRQVPIMLLMLHEQATTCQSFLLVVATATIASGLVSISFLAWCQSQKVSRNDLLVVIARSTRILVLLTRFVQNALLWQTLRKGNTDASTTANRRSLVEGENACGCLDCTASVLDRNANGYTCQERISYLVEQESFTEHDACTKIATQYPWSCGPECHPGKQADLRQLSCCVILPLLASPHT